MNFVAEELAQTELFLDVPQAVLSWVLEHAKPLELLVGEVLLSPERENHHVYLVLSGVLSVHIGSLASPEIRELTKGASVGEMSIIDGTPPSAYVIAKEASLVYPIHRDLLNDLLGDAGPVANNLLRLLTQRMKGTNQRVENSQTQIYKLSNQINVDSLTGLYNRRWMDGTLTRLLGQAAKRAYPLCILLIDVDHFKKYNDTQGHVGGDRALIAMGEVLKTTLRPCDFATRYGGEEFLIMLPNTIRDEGIAAAERIRKAAEMKVITSHEGSVLPGITVSIGLAMNEPDSTPQSLIAAADALLYQAKGAGRNCIRY